MNIQNLSICVPAKACINDCKFCCSKMHGSDYEDTFTPINTTMEYIENMRDRLQYARDNGCNTLMLTGNNEPQQNKEFLRVLGIVNKSLTKPFHNIEIQTSGAFIDANMLDFLKDIGVTTVAISVACIDNEETNRDIIVTKDKNLNISELSRMVKARNMNLRICLNMNDMMLANLKNKEDALEGIIFFCKYVNADQLTCRALWTSEDGTPQAAWIKEHVTNITHDFIQYFKMKVKENGRYLDTLDYGADRYDFEGLSTVVDEDSMAQSREHKDSVKYLILRPNGHLYSKWDSKASLIY